MKIKDIEKIALSEGEVLVIQVPQDSKPTHIWLKQAKEIRDTLATLLLSNNITVIPTGYKFTILSQKKSEGYQYDIFEGE
jgi:hypothetical protein